MNREGKVRILAKKRKKDVHAKDILKIKYYQKGDLDYSTAETAVEKHFGYPSN